MNSCQFVNSVKIMLKNVGHDGALLQSNMHLSAANLLCVLHPSGAAGVITSLMILLSSLWLWEVSWGRCASSSIASSGGTSTEANSYCNQAEV